MGTLRFSLKSVTDRGGQGSVGPRPSVPVGMRQARLSSVLEIDVTGEALHEHRDWVAGRFARQVLAGLRSTLR